MEWGEEGIDMLSRHLPQLKEINAKNSRVGRESVDILVERLPKLTVLNLKDNKMGHHSAQLCRLSSLKKLRVGQDGLVESTVLRLAKYLKILQLLDINRMRRSEMCIYRLRQLLSGKTRF